MIFDHAPLPLDLVEQHRREEVITNRFRRPGRGKLHEIREDFGNLLGDQAVLAHAQCVVAVKERDRAEPQKG